MKFKITFDGIKSRPDEEQDLMNDLEDRLMENNHTDQRRGEKIMQIENSLRELSDSIKCNNIRIRVISQEERDRRQKIHLKK